MTNTRITDPEIMEMTYPLRVEQFSLRSGSGGAGQHAGGEGVVRSIRALGQTTCTLVSSSRRTSPFGLQGASAGATGTQWVLRLSGKRDAVNGIATVELYAGDMITIETPGAGGFGRVPE